MPCGNVGTPELLIIFLLLLLLFGAKKLPALARSIGSGINEFKKGLESSTPDVEDLDIDSESSGKKKTKAKQGPGKKT